MSHRGGWFAVVLLSGLYVVPSCFADDGAGNKAEPILQVSVEVDFGRDVGQNFGSLFEVYDKEGHLVAGAGFLGAYNTQPRSDRQRLHFFVKPKQPRYEVELLPRVNQQTGVYLSDLGQTLFARSRSGPDRRFYAFDETADNWRLDEHIAGYETIVAGGPLQVGSKQVQYSGRTILDLQGTGDSIGENYYANGHLILRLYGRENDTHSNRLIACPWTPYGEERRIEFSQAAVLPLRSEREFVYAFGQLHGEVLAATNTGGVYLFAGGEWRVLVEPAAHSYQVYAMLNYYDRLLLGHYPTGEIYEYNGRELKHLPNWPPVMPGVARNAREAQTLSIYDGDLYAGVWPWGEVWRYDRNLAEWMFVRRMFDHPQITDKVTHPYETETRAVHSVLNLWGQRVTSLVPFRNSLFVGTSSKGGAEYDPKFTFLADGKWQDYGKVFRMTLPGQLSAPVEWKEGPTTFQFTLTRERMTIGQDGVEKGSIAVRANEILSGPADRLVWGRGVYGPLQGKLVANHASIQPTVPRKERGTCP